jgi:hypothetical protein
VVRQPLGRDSEEGQAESVIRDLQQQLDSVEQRRRTARSRLVDLRSAIAEEGRNPLATATTEDPTIAAACDAIECETLEALHEDLSERVVAAPGRVPDEEETDQLDDMAARLTDHHDALMIAIDRLEELADADSFDQTAVLGQLDDAVERTDHIGRAIQRLSQRVGRQPLSPESETRSTEYTVSGTVCHRGEPLVGVQIRVLDRDLDGTQILGETETNEHGGYRIGFGPDDFAAADLFGPDIQIEVLNVVGTAIASRETTNVGPEATIDVDVPADARVEPTEYALLRHELDQVLGDMSVETLSADQRDFIVDELELRKREAYPAGERTFDALSTAINLTGRTPFSEPLLYGLVRTLEDITLDRIRSGDPEYLAESIGGAVGSCIVDVPTEDLKERVAAGIEALDAAERIAQGTEVEATIAVQSPDGTGLPRYDVTVVDPDDERKRLRLRTDGSGTATFEYTRPAESDGESKSASESESESESGDVDGIESDPGREFRVTVINPASQTVHEGTVTVRDGSATITVERPSPGFSGAATVERVAEEASVELSEGADLSDATLADVRRAGGAANIAADLQADDPAVRRLDALASFDLMTDAGTGSALFEHGFADQFQIADADRDAFVAQVEGDLGRGTAERVHTTARTQSYLADNALTERRTILRNRSDGAGHGGGGDGE